MEQSHYKIFWRIGQEITPETFIQADNYICSQQNLIRRLIANQYYGLLPQPDAGNTSLLMEARISSNDILIDELKCLGITNAGYLIDFDNSLLGETYKDHLTIPDYGSGNYYVVLRVKPFEPSLIEPVENEEAPLARPEYEINVKELGRISDDELPVMKIKAGSYPEIDDDYIPPCMSITSSDKLMDGFRNIKDIITEINTQINLKKDQYKASIYHLHILTLELKIFPLTEPPVSLFRLIKKFVKTYIFFIPEIRVLTEPDFLSEYNHNDISIILKLLLQYLHEIHQIVSKIEIKEEIKVVVVEEDLTPKI